MNDSILKMMVAFIHSTVENDIVPNGNSVHLALPVLDELKGLGDEKLKDWVTNIGKNLTGATTFDGWDEDGNVCLVYTSDKDEEYYIRLGYNKVPGYTAKRLSLTIEH